MTEPLRFWQLDALSYREAPRVRYMVSGCGISALCYNANSVIYWMQEMVRRGGTPTVTEVEL
jgi:hypothetical protein